MALAQNSEKAAKETDTGPVSIDTVGADYARTEQLGPDTVDFLIWTAGQFGSWGSQGQQAYAVVAAKVGETIRVFMVNGGPNLTSSFHPIGNVWTKAWQQGSLASDPARYVQTSTVPPGSAFVGEMELPVPEVIKLVDHALSRVTSKGLLAEINVTGPENPGVFKPKA